MNEVIIVIIAIVVLIAAVIIYGVISTTMGYEEDVNQNYIPDRFERMLGADQKKKKAKKQSNLNSFVKQDRQKECLDNQSFSPRFTCSN